LPGKCGGDLDARGAGPIGAKVRPVVHLVTDGRAGPRATERRVRRLAAVVPDALVDVHLVEPCDTLAAGFCVAELSLAAEPGWRLVAHDVAAADTDPGPWPQRAGRLLCVARARGGVRVLGTNDGWCWSFAVQALDSCLYRVDVPAGAVSPLDALVTAVAHVRCGHPHATAGVIPRTAVPPLPQCASAPVDQAGRIDLSIMRLARAGAR